MNRKKKILVLYDNKLLSLSNFRNKGLHAEHTFKKLKLVSRLVRRIFKLLRLSQSYWYGDWKRNLVSFKTVIIFAPGELSKLRFIKKANNNIRIIYWYWNPVIRIGQPPPDLFKLAEVWSFDREDCRNFGFRYNSTFYFDNLVLPKNNVEIDAIFVGLNKGRRQYLQGLENLLNRNGVKSYFHIVPDKNESAKFQIKGIPYEEYLIVLSKSIAIIDIKPVGQSGLTVRPMESIFFEKKLITTDQTISSEDFYYPQNVFIIGKDDENYLKNFIDSPYFSLNKNIVANYDIDNWLKRFN